MKRFKHTTDGREDKPHNLYQAMGLAQKGCNKYKTDDVQEYVSTLKSMNMADIQRECIAQGIKPSADRLQLIKKLEKEFAATISSYKGAQMRTKHAPDEAGVDKRKRASDIMRSFNS